MIPTPTLISVVSWAPGRNRPAEPGLYLRVERQTRESTRLRNFFSSPSGLQFLGSDIHIAKAFYRSPGEIRRFKHRTNFHLSLLVERSALEPFNRLIDGLYLPQPVTAYEFLGLAEGTVDHRALLSRKPDALALRAWM